MIVRTILNFTGLYAAFQFCVMTLVQVFGLDIPSSATIGLVIGAACGAMMASVSAFGRAPNLTENWILSVSVNVCALIISVVLLLAMLYFSGGLLALEEFRMFLLDLPLEALTFGILGVFVLHGAMCLLIFGKLARRYLLRISAGEQTQ